MTDKIPQGFHTITPCISVKDAKKAIALYKNAFGAQEEGITICPITGKVMHACLAFGNSKFFLCDEFPETGMGASQTSFYLYVDDADSAFAKAREAGLDEKYALKDEFWGDRAGTVVDPFGIYWTIATHMRDVSPEEIEKASKKAAEKMQNEAA